MEAYAQLTAEGYLVSRQGAPTRVAARAGALYLRGSQSSSGTRTSSPSRVPTTSGRAGPATG